MWNKVKKSTWLPYAIIAFVGISLYANVINGPFFQDDLGLIVDNSYVHSIKNFGLFFTRSSGEGAGYIHNIYRPISMLTYGILYQIFHLNSFGYHIFNIFLHIINGILVHTLLRKFGFKAVTSLIAALFFLMHPTQVESVAYISGLPDILSGTFALLTLIFFTKLISENKKNTHMIPAICIFFLLGLLTKEVDTAIPLLAIAILIFMWKTVDKSKRKAALTVCLSLIAIDIAYIFLKLTVFSFEEGSIGLYEHFDIYSTNIHVRIVHFIGIIIEYFKIIFYPVILNFEKPFQIDLNGCSTTLCYYSLLTKNVSGLFGVFFIGLGVVCSIFSLKKKRIFFLGFVWFLAYLGPVSNILIPTNAAYKEHWLYIPMIGIIILLASAVEKLLTHKWEKIPLSVFLVLIFLFFTYKVTERNKDWANPERYYLHEIKYGPPMGRVHDGLGYIYLTRGQYDLAEEELKKVIKPYDKDPLFYLHVAELYIATGRDKLAEDNIKTALRLNPDMPQALRLSESLNPIGK